MFLYSISLLHLLLKSRHWLMPMRKILFKQILVTTLLDSVNFFKKNSTLSSMRSSIFFFFFLPYRCHWRDTRKEASFLCIHFFSTCYWSWNCWSCYAVSWFRDSNGYHGYTCCMSTLTNSFYNILASYPPYISFVSWNIFLFMSSAWNLVSHILSLWPHILIDCLIIVLHAIFHYDHKYITYL